MNFIEGEGSNVNLDEIKIVAPGLNLMFTPVSGSITLREGQRIVLGIRPEYVRIGEGGPIAARVYSTLPSGMETIVKLSVGSQLLTSVVFGAIDFEVDGAVGADFVGERCALFDKETGTKLAHGRLGVV
jgi:multiple sugar transport system ATP-binding protein